MNELKNFNENVIRKLKKFIVIFCHNMKKNHYVITTQVMNHVSVVHYLSENVKIKVFKVDNLSVEMVNYRYMVGVVTVYS